MHNAEGGYKTHTTLLGREHDMSLQLDRSTRLNLQRDANRRVKVLVQSSVLEEQCFPSTIPTLSRQHTFGGALIILLSIPNT